MMSCVMNVLNPIISELFFVRHKACLQDYRLRMFPPFLFLIDKSSEAIDVKTCSAKQSVSIIGFPSNF